MKKLSKKLKLNKETVSTLNNEQMNNVKGGAGSIITGPHTRWGCRDTRQDCISIGGGTVCISIQNPPQNPTDPQCI